MTIQTTDEHLVAVQAPQNAGGRLYGPMTMIEALEYAKETGGDIRVLHERIATCPITS